MRRDLDRQIGPIITDTIKLRRSSIPARIEIQHAISAKQDTLIGDTTQFSLILMS